MQVSLNRGLWIVLLSFFSCLRVSATHIIGGEVTYKFLDSVAGGNVYQFSLVIYEDCHNGSLSAIEADNPAFIAIYDGDNHLVVFDSVSYSASDTVPTNFSIECVKDPPVVCMIKKTFSLTATLPANASGYNFAYQRCCRNGALVNIIDPIDVGATSVASIPPATVARNNNSAVFTNYPPQIICVNEPLFYDNSATDADGDSLSYELCTSYNSDNALANNDPPPPPPYQPTEYVHPPYSYYNPMTGGPPLAIDPVTGFVTCTPLWIGRYLVTVCCNEWRHGVLINTIHREFQFVVTDCSKTVIADIPSLSPDSAANANTFIINCTDYTVHFINTSIGGSSWLWNFGVPGSVTDISTEFEPTFTYPDSGTFSVKLIADPGTQCADSIIKLVKIYPPFSAAFIDTGNLCPGAPVGFLDRSNGTINEVIDWNWNFGDGANSTLQNNTHTYTSSGIYEVTLVSENIKNCIDTFTREIIIENFKPFAGNDTIIVKGQSIQFNAVGGVQYEWAPATNLDNPNISNPVGFYPDTGNYNYIVSVLSSFGCQATDTINVWVVNQSQFFVPTGFTPNGDGKNDIFKPVAVGYKSINYFEVFDRWGEMVYSGNDFSEGWDGNYKGVKAQTGTYFWEISYVDISGKSELIKGDVTLIR